MGTSLFRRFVGRIYLVGYLSDKRSDVCEVKDESESSTFSFITHMFDESNHVAFTYVKVHAAFVGAWQQSVSLLYPAFCTAQRVSYVQRKSRPHLNRLMGSNSQPVPAEGHVGNCCAGKVDT